MTGAGRCATTAFKVGRWPVNRSSLQDGGGAIDMEGDPVGEPADGDLERSGLGR